MFMIYDYVRKELHDEYHCLITLESHINLPDLAGQGDVDEVKSFIMNFEVLLVRNQRTSRRSRLLKF